MNLPKRYEAGFTIVEIIAVLLLLSIIAATVMGRTVSTTNMNLITQRDKIRSHYRYAQSMAMKNGDAIWGIKRDVTQRFYWVFRLEHPVTNPVAEADDLGNHVMLPGEKDLKVDMNANDVGMLCPDVYFDRFGRPYLHYETAGMQIPFPATQTQTFTIYYTADSGQQVYLYAYPETGLIR